MPVALSIISRLFEACRISSKVGLVFMRERRHWTARCLFRCFKSKILGNKIPRVNAHRLRTTGGLKACFRGILGREHRSLISTSYLDRTPCFVFHVGWGFSKLGCGTLCHAIWLVLHKKWLLDQFVGASGWTSHACSQHGKLESTSVNDRVNACEAVRWGCIQITRSVYFRGTP
jgi:hypothetical protein